MLEMVAKYIILAVILVVIVWDVGVISQGRQECTLSAVALSLCKQHPIIAFSLGVLIGHLLWPNFG